MVLINRLAPHWRHLVSPSGALSVIGTVASYVVVALFAVTLFPEPASAQHPLKYCTNVKSDPSDPSTKVFNTCYVETRVCNKGEIDVYVVVAYSGGNNSSSTHKSNGWYSVERNECTLVSYDWVFHLGFLAAGDRSGILLDKDKGEIIYDDGSGWFSSGKTEGSEWGNNDSAFICVPEDPSGPFETTFRTWNADAACKKGFVRFPLSNWVTPYEWKRWNYIDLKIKPKLSHTRPDRVQVVNNVDGSRYEGQMRGNRRNGTGVLTWPNGHRYVGEFRDDKKFGRGVYTWPDGSKYDGEWNDDVMNGRGEMTWADGDKYDGEWKDNLRNGRGVFTLANGDTCEGEWREHKLVGTGEGNQNGVERPCYPREDKVITFEQP